MLMRKRSTICLCGSTKFCTPGCARYTAYSQLNEAYQLATWHHSSRPAALGLAEGVPTKWIGLEVKRHEQQDADHAIVVFVACYKLNGRAQRLHEDSRFMHEAERWLYVDGSTD